MFSQRLLPDRLWHVTGVSEPQNGAELDVVKGMNQPPPPPPMFHSLTEALKKKKKAEKLKNNSAGFQPVNFQEGWMKPRSVNKWCVT